MCKEKVLVVKGWEGLIRLLKQICLDINFRANEHLLSDTPLSAVIKSDSFLLPKDHAVVIMYQNVWTDVKRYLSKFGDVSLWHSTLISKMSRFLESLEDPVKLLQQSLILRRSLTAWIVMAIKSGSSSLLLISCVPIRLGEVHISICQIQKNKPNKQIQPGRYFSVWWV